MDDRIDRLLESAPVVRKMFFGNMAWFYKSNDQMIFAAWGSDVALRLGEETGEKLIASGQMIPFDPSGHRPKREYALILERQHSNDEYLLDWLQVTIKYGGTLPQKRKKNSRKGS
ncbi:MAG TPA: hypothetical protein EYG09_10135 [Dehalococcoidia bacterium]|nr:hypothetical protein [Dehalococcoidia bacterium]